MLQRNLSFRAVQSGELPLERKQKFWKSSISGSRMKKILDPLQRVTEWEVMTGRTEPLPITANPEKLRLGNKMEAIIAEEFAEQSGYGDRVVIDKRTFFITDPEFIHVVDGKKRPLLTFNIDGFVITEEGYELWKEKKITDEERINYVQFPIEIKNTTMDLDNLKKWYTSQCFDYFWKTNAKEPTMLVYFRNGYELNVYQFEKEEFEAFEAQVEPILMDFIRAVKEDNSPVIDAVSMVDDLPFVTTPTGELAEWLTQLHGIKQLVKINSDEEKALKAKIIGRAKRLGLDRNAHNILSFENLDIKLDYRQGASRKDWEGLNAHNNLAFEYAKNKLAERGLNIKAFFDYKAVPDTKAGNVAEWLTIKEVKAKKK